MRRVVIPPAAVQRDRITIDDPGELHHLLHVLRVKVGDPLDCFDAHGHSYLGRVVRCTRTALVLAIQEERTEAPPSRRLTLVQALIRPERFAWVVQKATELGVERLVPLVTARTTVRPAPARAERQVERWQRVSREAATQCGRRTVPRIEPPQRFDRVMPVIAGEARVIMPTLAAPASPLREAAAGLRHGDSVAAVIGPEGDFTPEEAALAKRHGARLVSLGGLTLRSETAALVTLAILQYEGTRDHEGSV